MKRNLGFGIALAMAMACKTTGGETESSVKFYGADNQSAWMTYEGKVTVAIPEGMNPQSLLQGQNRRMVRQLIERQIQHLFGAFTEHDAYRENPGIAYGRHEIDILGVEGQGEVAEVRYGYKDRVVFHKDLLAGGPREIEFYLPKDPESIYSRSLVPINRAMKIYRDTYGEQSEDLRRLKDAGATHASMCTDLHYNGEGDFWYFWNPDALGCPLKKDRDLVKVRANLEPIASTEKTYPYYDELYGDNGNGKVFHIVYLVGIDESFRSGDLGRRTFEEALDLLVEHGFVIDPTRSDNRNKYLTLDKGAYDVVLEMSLVDPNNQFFLRKAKMGLEKADVFIYDGHSGLGGYLYADRFADDLNRPLKLDPNKHQIFYFNGCSTYAYYNGDYFDLKKTAEDPTGSKKLDIITTSIGALFSIGARHDVTLIKALVDGERPSWQEIMDATYRVSPEETALTHVNGDEDNPSTP